MKSFKGQRIKFKGKSKKFKGKSKKFKVQTAMVGFICVAPRCLAGCCQPKAGNTAGRDKV